MSDLISRNVLLDAMPKNDELLSLDVRKVICDAPAVDAEPVVHAEWDHWGGDEWQCTNCAEFVFTEGSWERPWQKYCPYCGAKMDGGAVNGNT